MQYAYTKLHPLASPAFSTTRHSDQTSDLQESASRRPKDARQGLSSVRLVLDLHIHSYHFSPISRFHSVNAPPTRHRSSTFDPPHSCFHFRFAFLASRLPIQKPSWVWRYRDSCWL